MTKKSSSQQEPEQSNGLRRMRMLEPTSDLAEGIQRFMSHLILAVAFLAALVVIALYY